MLRKLFCLISFAVLLCAVSSAHAAVLEITPDAPEPGEMDIANFVGALTDADNVGTEDDSNNPPYWNDWCTYVAHDRGGQGQTFITGNSDVVMTGVWLKHVTYSGADPDQTWYQMQAGAELEIRVTDPAAAGTDAFVLASETYVVTGAEENALPADTTNDQTGTSLWIHITLDAPVALAASTEYGFDLTSLSGKAGVIFFETDGINDRAEGGNPYQAGTAYTSGVNPDDHGDDLNGANDNSIVVAPGDHVFVVELEAAAAPGPVVPFSLGAVEDIELGNDPQTGPDSNSNGSGLGARDIPDRRRVILISYDISALKERGPVSNVSFNHFSHDQHGEVNVYGVIEDLDLLEVESLAWNTAPGVQNDPTPALNSPVALDMNDLTDVLLSFAGPGETGIRFSTDTSQALDDFINSDTDGILTFLIAPAAEGNQLIVRARTHSAGGTLLEGDAPPLAKIIWVSDNLKYDFDAGVPSDQGFIDLLTAEGYLVDYKGQYDPHEPGNDEVPVNPDWLYWRELDDNKIAELEAADLIIIGRVNSSGSFDDSNEAEMWNAISTPLISQSAHISRQYSKWGWFATGSTTNKTPRLMQVTAPDHDIFTGVEIDPDGNIDLVVQDAQVTLVKLNEDVVEGNGTLLGVHDEGYPWIVEWAAGVEYYEGSGQIAGGPRMFLGSAVGATNAAAGLIEGGYNLTADGETVFLNAVKYMLPTKPVDPGTDGLVAHYAFENDTTDSSGNGLDGTIFGDATFIEGVEGMALDFNGDDYVDCGGAAEFSFTDAMTVSTWVNIRSRTTAWMAIIAKGENAWRLGVNNETTAIHYAFTGSARDWQGANTATELNLDEWYHVAATYDTNVGATVYINGAPDASNSDIGGIVTNEFSVLLGENPETTGRLFDGMLDEIMIYNRALSEEEILFLAGE